MIADNDMNKPDEPTAADDSQAVADDDAQPQDQTPPPEDTSEETSDEISDETVDDTAEESFEETEESDEDKYSDDTDEVDDAADDDDDADADEVDVDSEADGASTSPAQDTAQTAAEAAARAPKRGLDASDAEVAATVEALLFASDAPLPLSRIASVAELPAGRVKKAVAALNERYGDVGNSFRIEEIAGGYQMLTLPEYNDVLRQLFTARKDSRLSQAAMETLAIIAYRQPILRADIEAIRGVACGEVLRSLLEKNMVKIVGRAEVIGRPMLYGTTKTFLEVFGLGSLDDLPRVEELRTPEEQQADRDDDTTEKSEGDLFEDVDEDDAEDEFDDEEDDDGDDFDEEDDAFDEDDEEFDDEDDEDLEDDDDVL